MPTLAPLPAITTPAPEVLAPVQVVDARRVHRNEKPPVRGAGPDSPVLRLHAFLMAEMDRAREMRRLA